MITYTTFSLSPKIVVLLALMDLHQDYIFMKEAELIKANFLSILMVEVSVVEKLLIQPLIVVIKEVLQA